MLEEQCVLNEKSIIKAEIVIMASQYLQWLAFSSILAPYILFSLSNKLMCLIPQTLQWNEATSSAHSLTV